MIDFLLGRLLFLFLAVAVAVAISQHYAEIVSLLVGVLLFLAVTRLLWPLPRR